MAGKSDDIQVTEGGSKSKLPMIIIAVVIIIIGAVGAMMFLGGDEDKAAKTKDTEESATPLKSPPIYRTVEAPFVVNFASQSNNQARYLQVKLKVMARDQLTIDAFQLHEPAIQHELLMLLYGESYDNLNTTAGTKKLRESTLALINSILTAENVEKPLEAVYFTSLIMQ